MLAPQRPALRQERIVRSFCWHQAKQPSHFSVGHLVMLSRRNSRLPEDMALRRTCSKAQRVNGLRWVRTCRRLRRGGGSPERRRQFPACYSLLDVDIYEEYVDADDAPHRSNASSAVLAARTCHPERRSTLQISAQVSPSRSITKTTRSRLTWLKRTSRSDFHQTRVLMKLTGTSSSIRHLSLLFAQDCGHQ